MLFLSKNAKLCFSDSQSNTPNDDPPPPPKKSPIYKCKYYVHHDRRDWLTISSMFSVAQDAPRVAERTSASALSLSLVVVGLWPFLLLVEFAWVVTFCEDFSAKMLKNQVVLFAKKFALGVRLCKKLSWPILTMPTHQDPPPPVHPPLTTSHQQVIHVSHVSY